MSKMKRARSTRAAVEDMGQRFILNRITATLLISVGAVPAWADSNNITVHNGTFNSGPITVNGLNTATTITPVNGTSITNITTGTQRGQTAFNSFGDFSVGAGNTVNLVVPDSASNLVNLVHNSQAVVNGTLNGVQGGKIGGNIIFADPNGMVVGASGVVNVGSLTITTPTGAQMQSLANIAVNGTVAQSDQAAADLIAGKYTGGSGSLSVSGKINSSGSVNLFAAAATVANGAKINAGVDFADAVFRSTVNVTDAQGTGVVRKDGAVQIVADKTVAISGELNALMADNSGGSVHVKAGTSITLDDGATASTAGTINAKATVAGKAGGQVTLEAPAIVLGGHATINTSATGAGTAGDITLKAYSDISVDTTSATTVAELQQQLQSQAQPLLQSNLGKASVNIGANATLVAGQASDSSKRGNVSVTAFAFDKQLAGYADANGSIDIAGQITAKDILLHASGEAMISNTLLGSLVTNGALSADFAKLKSDNGWTDADTWASIISTLGDAGSSVARAGDISALGLNAADWSELVALLPNISVAIANANASVNVRSTAVLNAAGDIDIAAQGTRTVDTSTDGLVAKTSFLPYSFAVGYGRVSGSTTVDVASGAHLTSAGDLSLKAQSTDLLNQVASAVNNEDGTGTNKDGSSTASDTTGFAFGMAHSEVTTRAQVASGAILSVARDTSVTAFTEQTLSNLVSFKALGPGAVGGPAIALTLFDSTTQAIFDADLSGGRNLSVSALNLIDGQDNSASVESGLGMVSYYKNRYASSDGLMQAIAPKFSKLFNITPVNKGETNNASFRLASAAAIGIANHTAEAIIGSNGSAPTLSLTGDLTVQALQRESDMHNAAESSANSSVKGKNTATDTLSVAAAYNQLSMTTHALIGDGVTATANRLGVGAFNQQLLDLEGMDRWSSLTDVLNMLKDKNAKLIALPNQLSTNFANAKGDATSEAMAGSLTVMVNNLDATAWVGNNVTLTATGSDVSEWKTTPLAGLAPVLGSDGKETASSAAARALSFSWDSPLTVKAGTEVEQIQISGNFATLLFNKASDADGSSAGGTVNVQVTSNSTIAGIGGGGTITAKAVRVDAQQDELIVGVSPSAGSSPSSAGNGAVVVSVDNATVAASVNSSTSITADQVAVNAEHRIGMWTAAGAFGFSQNSGIGASIALNVLTSDVEALVGNNQQWRPDAINNGSQHVVVPSGAATWHVDGVALNAQSDGQVGAFAVAGAKAKSEAQKQEQAKTDSENGGADSGALSSASAIGSVVGGSLGDALSSVADTLGTAQNTADKVSDAKAEAPSKLQQAVDAFRKWVKGDPAGEQGTREGLSLAVAGSVGINASRQTTRASLGDIVLDPRNPTGNGSEVTVQALNQTNQLAGAGGGAFTLAGGPKSEESVAIAGAIAYDYLSNTTEALMQNVTLNGNHALAINAISAGDQVAMGLGLAVANGGVENDAVALSASAATLANTTRAAVVNSSVTQKGAGSIAVNAFDRTRVLIGGGSFASSQGTGTSAGAALAVGVLANTIQAQWLGSSASGFASFDVAAISATRLLAGALSVTKSTGAGSSAGAGSLFALVVNNNIDAEVGASDQGNDSSLTGGAVNVAARSASNDTALDALIAAASNARDNLSGDGIDMDGSSTASKIDGTVSSDDSLTGGSGTTEHSLYSGGSSGEAIMGIAGGIAGTSGESAGGAALGVIYNNNAYTAKVANTGITLTGDLNIIATDATEMLAASVGAAISKGTSFAGSATAVIGRGKVDASLDMSGRTLAANNLQVTAARTAAAYSLAGNISGATKGSAIGAAISLTDLAQGASATVSHGQYVLAGNATIAAAGQSQIITAAVSVAGSTGGNAVGGAVTYNRVSDTTRAALDDVRLSAGSLKVSASNPDQAAGIASMAVNISAAGGGNGIGGALAVNLIDATRSAQLSDSTVNLRGDATLSSSLDGEILGMGVNAALSSGNSVGGSVVVNNISGGDSVGIDNSSISTVANTGKALSLDASGGSGLVIRTLAGAITGGSDAAVGGAISVNRISANRTASLTDTTVSGFASNSLKSGVDQSIYAIAVAGSGGDVAVSGSSTINILSGSEKATISGGSVTGGSLTLSAAEGDRTIWSLAGAISGAGSVAVGVANANNIITASREASISSARLNLTQALNVQSGGSATIRSAAVGGGGAGTAAVGASVAVNVISGTENASLDGVTLQGASAVNVDVSRGEADIKTLAGNVQGAGTGAGAGAVAVSTVDQQRNASVSNSSLSLGSGNSGIVVNALTSGSIQTMALSGAAAGTGAVALSNTTNLINAVTHASVLGSTGTASVLKVTAKDSSSIDSLAGGAAIGGTAAVGVATAVNRIGNDIAAHLGGNLNNTATWALNDVTVSAGSDATINTASISASFSGTAAVSAGVAYNQLSTATKALIDGGARLVAQNNVGVLAADHDVIRSAAAVVAGSGNAAVSGLVTVNQIDSSTEAGIAGTGTQVTALGNGGAQTVDSGALLNNPDPATLAAAQQLGAVASLQTGTEAVHGLAVRATSLQQLSQSSLSAGVSLVPISSAAISGLSNTSVVGGDTTAYIDGASINASNTGANAAQQVSVGAASHSFSFGAVSSGALSLGAAAVAAAVDTGVVSRDVIARISHASVNSLGATSVQANSTQAASNLVTTAGGGIVGVAGGVGVQTLKGSTQALVGQGSVLNVGALDALASAINRLTSNAGTVAGGLVGAGAGINVGYNQSTVRAWVGEVDPAVATRTSVNSMGAVNITASSDTQLVANAISASGGGVAVAGAGNILMVENVTEAGAQHADFGTSAQRSGSLNITATDKLSAALKIGTVSGGGVSIGASANVLVTNNATRAELLDSSAWLNGALAVAAKRTVNVGLTTLTGSAGLNAALGGAVGVLLLGSGSVDQNGNDAMGELDHGGNGTLSMADSLGNHNNADTTYQSTTVDANGKVTLATATASGASLDAETRNASVKARFVTTTAYKQETVARLSNATVNANGAASVTASDLLKSSNTAGGAFVSGGASMGAAAAFTLSNARVNADILGGSLTAASLDLSASSAALDSNPAVSVSAYNGATGLGVGLGAAVAIGVLDNTVAANLGGRLTLSGLLKAQAFDTEGLSINALGAALGLVGAGAVVGVAEHDSQVNLTVADNAVLSAGDIDLAARSLAPVTLNGQGAAGGLLAGVNAVVLTADDSSAATLSVGRSAQLLATQTLAMNARVMPQVSATSLGVALGWAAAGGVVVDATAKASANLTLADNVTLQAQSASLTSEVLRNGSNDSVTANGTGVSGGWAVAVNALVANASNTSASLVQTADTSHFIGLVGGSGAWTFGANTDVRQRSTVSGAAGGALVLGANVATATASDSTQALVGGHFSGTLGALKVSASAKVDNQAKASAGQGGLISGSAAVASTQENSTTSARLYARGVDDSSVAQFQSVELTALHQSYFNAFVDSTTAALVGASGARAQNDVTINTTSELAANSQLDSYAYSQRARTDVTKAESADYNVNSGSGGLLNGSAAQSLTNVALNTRSLVGNQARAHLIGDFRVPQDMLVSAYNGATLYDRTKLDAGGAINVAYADSKINVNQADASVTLGNKADLASIGDVVLSASGDYTVSAAGSAKTYGLASGAGGTSQAKVKSAYDIVIMDEAQMLADGDIRLYAGENASGSASQATLTARTDLWNNSLVAINKADAQATYDRASRIDVAAGALVNSVGDIYAYADEGWGNLLAKGVAKDLFSSVASLVGVTTETDSGTATNIKSGVVNVNGAFNSGYLNNRSVHITGLEYYIDGVKVDPSQVGSNTTGTLTIKPVVSTSDANITYRLVEGTYSQYISARLKDIDEQLTNYGVSSQEQLALSAERTLLQKALDKLYTDMGGDTSGGVTLSRDQKIQIFELDPVLAKPGNVFVKGTALIGSGTLKAPGDATISVVNDSSAFLRILGLEVPYREGGQLLFNNASMVTNAAVEAANGAAWKGQAKLGITVSATSPDPIVTVINTYNPATGVALADGLKAPAPDIFVQGRIFNQRGAVSVTAAYGSVYANADIRGKTLSISAGKDFVLNSEDAFFHVGGDPATNNVVTQATGQPAVVSLTGPAAGSGVVAANNVVINAQYLNINGLIQSGVAAWTATIAGNDSLNAQISIGRTAYQLGGAPVIQLVKSDALTGQLGYSYDFRTERLVLDQVDVAGGYMELTGYILSTGNGQLKVLDGYSQVAVNNTSAYTLGLSAIDLGSHTQGTLRINDVRVDGSGNEYVYSSIYTRDLNTTTGQYQMYLQQGLSSNVLTATQQGLGTDRTATYNPVTGRSYVWLTGQDGTKTTITTYYKDNLWGAFKTGDGTEYSQSSYVSGERPIEGAEYLGSGSTLAVGTGTKASETYTVNDKDQNGNDITHVSTKTWTSCHKWFLWCQVKRSWSEVTEETGTRTINRYTVQGDSPIAINFIGSDVGSLNVNSAGNVVLLGSLYNPTGNTSITTAGSLTQASAGLVTQAANLTLKAANGIGSSTQALDVQVTGNLSALSSTGDVNIAGLNGNLNLAQLEATRGNVVLSAQGNITANSGMTVRGHGISLTSTHGAIGSAGSLLNLDTNYDNGAITTSAATLKASAVDGIFLNEVSGDLLVDQVLAGGDVVLKVANGDLVDGNTSLAYDQRSLDDLKTLWSSMSLSGAEAATARDAQEKSLLSAGQSSYERYWQLRTDKGTRQIGAFDLAQVAFTDAQIAQIKAQDPTADIAKLQAQANSDYAALDARFGGLSYDANYHYQLSTAEQATLQKTYAWSTDQLQYSVSSALLGRGTDTQVKIEDMNVQGRNVTLSANRVGKVLADDVYIDLSKGLANLTSAQLAALAGAELDDVYHVNANDPSQLRIVQRDDVNVAASGNLTVTANKDVYIGGKQDLNIYNVRGDTVRIKTDGNIESANGSNVVITGHDVVLESSNGAIGGNGAVHLNVSGDLTARAQVLNLAQAGDLSIARLTGLTSLTLNVGGNLLASGQNGEHLLGGVINLLVGGNIGSAGNRIQLNSQGSNINLQAGGDAWIGAVGGIAVVPGTLDLGAVQVGGHLDIGQAVTVNQHGNWALGSLAMALDGNWIMDVGSETQADDALVATVAGDAVLGNLTATSLDLDAARLTGNASGVSLAATDSLRLRSASDIGRSDRRLTLAGKALDAQAVGAIYANLAASFQRGTLQSGGALLLTTLGASTLDRVQSVNGALALDGQGLFSVGQLLAHNSLNASGTGLSLALGQLTSSQGDLLLNVGGDTRIDNAQALNGKLTLAARNAQLGDVQVLGNADMTLAQGLTLTRLAANHWQMTAANATVGQAQLRGAAAQTVSGQLQMTSLTSAGSWTLRGGAAQVAAAQVGGAVESDTSGLLRVGTLNGGAGWLLHGTDAQLGTVTLAQGLQAQLSGDLNVSDRVNAADTHLTLGSGSHINALNVVGELALKVTGVLDLGSAVISGQAMLDHLGAAGTALHYGSLQVGNTLEVSGAGDWRGDTAQVQGNAQFNVGSATLGSLISQQGRLLLQASGLFAASNLQSVAQDVNLAAGHAQLGSVQAHSDFIALTDGELQVSHALAGNNIDLQTVAGSRGAVRIGAYYADPLSGFSLANNDIKADNDLNILTDGNIYGGNAVAGKQVHVVGRNLDFGRIQSLQEDVFIQSTGPYANGEGNITGLVVDAKRDVNILASGNLSMPTVKFGGTYSLKAGRDLMVGVGGDLDVSGDASAGRDLTFLIGGSVDLRSLTAGRNVLVTSGQSINIADGVTAGGDIRLAANGGDLNVGTGVVSTGVPYQGQTLTGSVVLQASGNITTPVVSAAAGSINANGRSLRFTDLTASGSTNLQARGLIQVAGTSRSGGDQQWQAEESIGFGRLLTQGQALLDSLLDTRGSVLQADRGAVLNAGWRNNVASDASIHLGQATAPTLSLWAGNLINVADANIGQAVDLHGQDLSLYGRHTGSGQLNLWVTGSGQASALRFDANLDARDIVAPHFYAVNGKLVTSADKVDLQDAAYVDLLDLQTQKAHVIADNLTPLYQHDADVQLYELDKAFAFKQQAVTSTTNAYVVHRRDTHQVLIPNFSVQHAPVITGVMVQGVSAARYGEQQASGRAFAGIVKQLLQSATLLPTQGQWIAPQWGTTPADVHINLNLDNASTSDNGAKTWDL